MDKNLSYQQARRIRKTGFSGILADQMLYEPTVAKAIGRTLSLKLQSQMMGIKERFDPLNIAKRLTFGSKLGPSLLGKMTGRSRQDIEYFTGRLKPIAVRKIGKKITPLPKEGEQLVEGQNVSIGGINKELLKIYKFLKVSTAADKKRREMTHNFDEEKQLESERRHKELLKKLSELVGKKTKTTGKVTKVEEPEEDSLFDSFWGKLLTKVPLLSWLAAYVAVPALAGYLFNQYWQNRKELKSAENIEQAGRSGGQVAADAAAEMERLRKSGDEISDPTIRDAMEVQQGIRDDAINRMDAFREDFYKHSGFKKKKSIFGNISFVDSAGNQPSADMIVASQQFADDQYRKIFTGEVKDPIGKFTYKAAPAPSQTKDIATTPTAGAGRGGQGGPTAAQAVQNTGLTATPTPSAGNTDRLNSAITQNVDAQLPKQKAEDNVTINNVVKSANKQTQRLDKLSELSVRNDEPTLLRMIMASTRVV